MSSMGFNRQSGVAGGVRLASRDMLGRSIEPALNYVV